MSVTTDRLIQLAVDYATIYAECPTADVPRFLDTNRRLISTELSIERTRAALDALLDEDGCGW